MKINIGVIGCGYWGPNFVRIFASLPNVNMKWACDARPQRLKEMGKRFPEVRPTLNYKDILNDRETQTLVIATQASGHYSLAKEALLAGKDVLVEKPLTLNYREAEDLVNLAKAKGRILMVSHTFLFNPAVEKIKEIISQRKLGKIYYAYARRTNLGPIRNDASALWDLAPHDIAIFSFLLDASPIEVSCRGAVYLNKNIEDVGFLTLTYPKDIIVHLHVSWLDFKKVREIAIIGERRMLFFNDIDLSCPLRLYDKRIMKRRYRHQYDTFAEFKTLVKEGEVECPKVKRLEPLREECSHFLACVRTRSVPISDGEFGAKVVGVLQAAEASLKQGGGAYKVKG